MSNALRRKLADLGLMVPEQHWSDVFITHFRTFKAEYGHAKVSLTHVCSDGYKIGLRVDSIRQRRNRLTPEKRAALDAEGFIWDASHCGAWWPEFIDHLRAYKAAHGHVRVPHSYRCPKGYRLGTRVQGIRQGGNRLTPEQRALLDTEGFIWNASTTGLWWPEFIEHFRAYKAENGHSRVPREHVCSDGFKLGMTVTRVRSGVNRATPEQRAVLDAEGFPWTARDWWPEFIEHFRVFKAEFGHTRVPLSYVCSDGYKLGSKVSGVRSGNNNITDEQRAALDTEGFIWDASITGAWWVEFIDHFRAYRAENGHTTMPNTHVCPDGYKLGQRMGGIRSGRNRVTPEQRALLDAEGFIWRAQGSTSPAGA